MTFIVTLTALLIERFFDWSHIRHWSWYTAYQRVIAQRLPGKAAYLVLAATIIPLLLAVVIVSAALDGFLYGLASLLFQLFVVLYCLGPQNLWADAFASINALVQSDAQTAADKLKALFGVTNMSSAHAAHRELLNQIFVQSNSRVFAVVFWYVILGPVGAVLYRTISMSSNAAPNQEASPQVAQIAHSLELVLDWLPIRVYTFIFALGGHFSQVLTSWRRQVMRGVTSNQEMLTDCGVAALANPDAEDGSSEKEAIALLDRVFVIVLVIVAVVVLVV